MTKLDDIKTPAEALKEVRALLAVITREARNRGVSELVELTERVDVLVADLVRRGTN